MCLIIIISLSLGVNFLPINEEENGITANSPLIDKTSKNEVNPPSDADNKNASKHLSEPESLQVKKIEKYYHTLSDRTTEMILL